MSSLRPRKSCGVLGGGEGVGRNRNYDVWRCERLIAARRVTGDYFLIAAIKRERDRHGSVLVLPAFDVRVPLGECLLDVLQRETSRLKRYSMGDGTWGKKRDGAYFFFFLSRILLEFLVVFDTRLTLIVSSMLDIF